MEKSQQFFSLKYVNPAFIPLGEAPHPLWTTCQANPSSVYVASIQAQMLSGSYRLCYMVSHWLHTTGQCRLPGCGVFPGDVSHILTACTHLSPIAEAAFKAIDQLLSNSPVLSPPIKSKHSLRSSDPQVIVKFTLDPSTDSVVIPYYKMLGNRCHQVLFKVSRIFIWHVT